MSAMTATGLPFGRPLTIDDLERLPDDGHRYELLDGTLLVSPSPGWAHQDAVGRTYLLLMEHCPPEFRVVVAPFAVTFGRRDTELQPDVLVARYDDLRPQNLPAAPLLAVEVRSPSTAMVDLNLKKAAYERFGVASYWLIDPQQPSLHAFDLIDGHYVEVADVAGDEVAVLERPFRVDVCPAELRRGVDRE